MPTASPFLEGGLCFLKSENTWDCEDYSMYEEFGLYSASVVTAATSDTPPTGLAVATPTTAIDHSGLAGDDADLALLLPSVATTKTISLFGEVGNDGARTADDWTKKPVCNWETSDTIDWLLHVAKRYHLSLQSLQAGAFMNLKGSQLLQMSLSEFLSRDPLQGRHFYAALQQMLIGDQQQIEQQQQQQQQHSSTIDENVSNLLGLSPIQANQQQQQQQQQDSYSNLAPCNGFSDTRPIHHNLMGSDASHVLQYCLQNNNNEVVPSIPDIQNNEHVSYSHYHNSMEQSIPQSIDPQCCNEASDVSRFPNNAPIDIDPADFGLDGDWNQESVSGEAPSDDSEENFAMPECNSPKKAGRPKGKLSSRRKTDKGFGRLWEFIRDLLHDPRYCPSMVRWENVDEGIFRIVKSEQLAALWGNIKNNPRMTYEKLSRAMRYYYKSRVFLPVLGRRLVYKFGPSAVHWRPEDPNFEKRNSLKVL